MILLVEKDNAIISQIKSSILSHPDWKDCHLEVFKTTAEALREMSVRNYDILLIDCQSASASPLETLIQIRAVVKNKPLILLNNPGMEKTAIACLNNGANSYLLKEGTWAEELPMTMTAVFEEYQKTISLRNKLNRLEEQNKELRSHTVFDKTTAFFSTPYFESIMARELHRANRYGLSLACLILDVGTKKEVLSKIKRKPLSPLYEKLALLLRSLVRSSDIWARLTENRFAAIMPHTSAPQARNAIKRIQSEIHGTPFTLDQTNIPIRIRWGLSHFDKNKMSDELELIKNAKSNLKEWRTLSAN